MACAWASFRDPSTVLRTIRWERLLAVVIQGSDPADVIGELIGAGKIEAVFPMFQLPGGPAFIADDAGRLTLRLRTPPWT